MFLRSQLPKHYIVLTKNGYKHRFTSYYILDKNDISRRLKIDLKNIEKFSYSN